MAIQVIYAKPSIYQRIVNPLIIFSRALRRNKVGAVGFIGLVFYALLITIGPLIVPFDGEVSLDQIAAPPGSRLQLLTRKQDAGTYKTLDDLTGKTVGVISSTRGVDLVKPYADKLTVDRTSWRNGDGVPAAMQKLADGKVDALIVFSESVKKYLEPNTPAAQKLADLTVSNPAFGPSH